MRILPAEIIRRKRDGETLSPEVIDEFIRGVVTHDVSDAQIAAFSMATYFQGLNPDERTAITRSMAHSGTVLTWDADALGGPVLDKHSTGGVGDTVSLILAPLLASVGGFVPMIAGRGLAHTGGTIDKLESIPGYNVACPLNDFQRIVRAHGFAITGQTPELAPADARMYATRDVTATVEQNGLITASILSKKLAAGLQFLLMDIKTGSGAFMRTREQAESLAEVICAVGNAAGMNTEAMITDMAEPLANSAGNALEVLEALEILQGKRTSGKLLEVTLDLAERMCKQSGLDAAGLRPALSSGVALEKFAQVVHAMGGPSDFCEKPERYMPSAPVVQEVPAPAGLEGRVVAVDTRELGMAVVDLGGGRKRTGDAIDYRVGAVDWMRPGDAVGSGPLAILHAADEASFERAAARIQSAYTFE